MGATFGGKRSKERPKKIKEDAVHNNSHQILEMRNWNCVAGSRDIWRKKLEELRARYGL